MYDAILVGILSSMIGNVLTELVFWLIGTVAQTVRKHR